MATRDELVAAVAQRYREADRANKSKILDEFSAVTGFHRKHAMRLLRPGLPSRPRSRERLQRRLYTEAVREALLVLWEASDRICSKRLKILIPLLIGSMERHGHLALAPEVKKLLQQMSAATIDRVLRTVRERTGRPRRRTGTPSAIRRSIPVRTLSDWQDPPPGFVEADLVAHSGPSTAGSFVQTLVLTDIATGWTECAPLLVREQVLLSRVLDEVRRHLPFDLLGFDTDNDTVFLNETIRDYCQQAGIEFTRCRPYRKNDQAFVEQKNGALVRRIVGYRRLEGLESGRVLAKLYAVTRLFVNVFQPSFKLAEKSRDGARVTKRYHVPATPCDRLLAHPSTSEATRSHLERLKTELDPIKLLTQMRSLQEGIVALADQGVTEDAVADPASLEAFLTGLRTVWRDGEVRPTAQPKPKRPRGRRRPDPLVAVTQDLKAWFDAEPWLTARSLLERLQRDHPNRYPDGLMRTVQRRLKRWRSDAAHGLVFGAVERMTENLPMPKRTVRCS